MLSWNRSGRDNKSSSAIFSHKQATIDGQLTKRSQTSDTIMELYVLTNQAMPGLIKVGMTTKSASERETTLTGSAAVPEHFQVDRSYKFPDEITYKDLLKVELAAHKRLSAFRYSDSKEFFTCTPEQAGAVLEQLQIEAKDYLDRGLTIIGQARQAVLTQLFEGDKGRKTTFLDKIKPRNHWHVWTATSQSNDPSWVKRCLTRYTVPRATSRASATWGAGNKQQH